MPRLIPLAALLAGALALSGCAVRGENPNPPVPVARTETIPLPPVSGTPQLWEPGHWEWAGNGYTWIDGKWIARDGHSTTWQNGYWARNPTSGTWTWQPGHWVQ